jgi:hypothetical protein
MVLDYIFNIRFILSVFPSLPHSVSVVFIIIIIIVKPVPDIFYIPAVVILYHVAH